MSRPTLIAVLAVAISFVAGRCLVGGEISYNQQIHPLLAEHCLTCHGNDERDRQADLQLDDEASAKSHAIIAGEPDASPLIMRLLATDADERMPPDGKPPLTSEQIAIVRQWIAEGARYERHWSLEPIHDAPPPDVAEQLTDIDRFIVAKLNEYGLSLSPPATKQQLIRRATFDLTGLPPRWDDVVAFVNDESPDAFVRVVDRLLASPAYGERWGRHWLDIARYADTQGGAAIGFQKFAFSYTYRDYVINAFNEDIRYDQFVTEQLAADQLELPDNARQLAALGFLTVGMRFRSPHDIIDDRIDVVTRGLMGLTVACARCHDHKYDAIPTHDYYALYATFASSSEPDPLPLVGTADASQELDEYHAELERLQTSFDDMAREQNVIMRARLRAQIGMYLREIAKGASEVDLSTTDVFSYRTDDIRPPVVERWRRYISQMPESDPVFGPWVRLAQLDAADFRHTCDAAIAAMTQENGDEPKDVHRLSANAPRWNPRVLAAISQKQPGSMLDVADAYGALFVDVQQEWLEAQVAAATEAIPGTEPVPDEDPQHATINSPVNRQLRRYLYAADSPTNMDDMAAIQLLNRPIHDNVFGRKGAVYNLNLNASGSPPRAMALQERADPGPFYVFNRGNPVDRGAPVVARFLTVASNNNPPPFEPGKRRLSLARSIVAPENPLTRRVIVNWVWQRHFGIGLVRTPDDFGTRGERPTHPQLLDYLASRLLQDSWSLKSLHRRIMLTRVYQQGAIENVGARTTDPDNRWLWRMPRHRLEVEAMRDAMLAVSGELQEDRGGRPFELLAQPTVARRSVYAFINRDIVAPLLSTFDGANPSACTAKRPDTTVPQQTLFALNSDFIQDRAQALAESVASSATNLEPRVMIRTLYHRVYARDPDDTEIGLTLSYLDRQSAAGNPKAAWQRLAHALLAANEFVFVD
ncbi:MAG: PSD1 and planctomycete cytochrome C domain-containing protein [Pirellulaceae bacterium]|nr:DUF1553 domain-containing protein [Planctomycetales bacterium]